MAWLSFSRISLLIGLSSALSRRLCVDSNPQDRSRRIGSEINVSPIVHEALETGCISRLRRLTIMSWPVDRIKRTHVPSDAYPAHPAKADLSPRKSPRTSYGETSDESPIISPDARTIRGLRVCLLDLENDPRGKLGTQRSLTTLWRSSPCPRHSTTDQPLHLDKEIKRPS